MKLKKQLLSSALLSTFADFTIWLVLEYILVNVLQILICFSFASLNCKKLEL